MNAKEIVDEIKRRGLTAYRIATDLPEEYGLTQVGIDKIISGRSKSPRKRTLDILEKYLHNSFADTDMKAITVYDPFEQYVIPNKNGNELANMPDGSFLMKVPLIPIKAYARYISEGDDADVLEGFDFVFFKVDHFGKGKYRAFEIKGDSMDGGHRDDTPDKAIALGRELGRQHWRDGFRDSLYGFIIITKNNIVFKDIIDQDLSKGIITCHSRNPSPEYSDFQLSLDEDIHAIFKVIKRQF